MAQVVYIDIRTACNGSCETHAGCDCCTQLMPAEACTEVGAEPEREQLSTGDAVIVVLALLSSALLVVSGLHLVARLLP
jgi:hypothetical protein